MNKVYHFEFNCCWLFRKIRYDSSRRCKNETQKSTETASQHPELDKQNKHIHLSISILMIILSALGQTFVMQVFMEPCNLISGGFTGIALFMQKVLARIGIPFSTSLGILLLNVPAALWAYKRISKRFVMLTACSSPWSPSSWKSSHSPPWWKTKC